VDVTELTGFGSRTGVARRYWAVDEARSDERSRGSMLFLYLVRDGNRRLRRPVKGTPRKCAAEQGSPLTGRRTGWGTANNMLG
jgi:hypothetical protein